MSYLLCNSTEVFPYYTEVEDFLAKTPKSDIKTLGNLRLVSRKLHGAATMVMFRCACVHVSNRHSQILFLVLYHRSLVPLRRFLLDYPVHPPSIVANLFIVASRL